MSPRTANLWRAYRRWRARTLWLASRLLCRQARPTTDLAQVAKAHVLAPTPAPVVVVAHHSKGLYHLAAGLGLWFGQLIVFVNPAAQRFLHVLQRIGIIPRRVEFVCALTSEHVRRLKAGSAILLAFCDIHVTEDYQFHHVVDGRLRRFNAAWAVVAKRLGARVICLRPELNGISCTLEHCELSSSDAPYTIATNALCWFLDSDVPITEWDFCRLGELEPHARPIDGPDDLVELYRIYGGSAAHQIRSSTPAADLDQYRVDSAGAMSECAVGDRRHAPAGR